MNNVLDVIFYTKDLENRTRNVKITNTNTKLINMFYSMPEVKNEIKHKSKGDRKSDVVVDFYSREFGDTQLELEFLIKKSTTHLTTIKNLKNDFRQTIQVEIFPINKFYSITPYKFVINKEYKEFYHISMIVNINGAIENEYTYNFTAGDTMEKDLFSGNNSKHFYFSGENLNGSTVKLLIKTDHYDNLFIPIVDIPFGVNYFVIDTKNSIYAADGKDLLDINNYNNIKDFKRFARSITNNNAFNYNTVKMKAEFTSGECIFKFYQNNIF